MCIMTRFDWHIASTKSSKCTYVFQSKFEWCYGLLHLGRTKQCTQTSTWVLKFTSCILLICFCQINNFEFSNYQLDDNQGKCFSVFAHSKWITQLRRNGALILNIEFEISRKSFISNLKCNYHFFYTWQLNQNKTWRWTFQKYIYGDNVFPLHSSI